MKRPFDFMLYAITAEALHPGRPLLSVMEEVLRGGADIVQLRDKTASRAELLEKGRALRALTRRYGVPFIVNDDPELALAVDADGVHLGQEDGGVAEARALLGPERIIGVSTHALEQALASEAAGADYIGVGPVFATATKPGRPPVTTAYVREAAAAVRIPWVAIGGITLANADEVLAAGASRLCAVSAIVGSDDPAAVCRALRARIDAHRAAGIDGYEETEILGGAGRPERQQAELAQGGAAIPSRESVRLRVNGRDMTLAAGNVEEAADFFGLLGRRIVVELNGRVLRREEWASARLTDGSSLELVQFVGGG